MKSLQRRIFRERRRLIIVAVLCALAGYIMFLNDTRHVMAFPMPTVASVAFGVGFSLVALVVCLIQPSFRFAAEILGLTLFLYALISAYVPSISLESAPIPVLIMIMFMIAAQTLYHLIYGSWSDKFMRQKLHVDRATALSALDRQDLWLNFYPDPRNVENYFDQTVEEMGFVDDERDMIHIVNRFRDGLFREVVAQFDQVKPGWSFRYEYEVLGAEEIANTQTPSYTLVLEPRGDDTAIHVRWERHNYPTRKAMMHWIDDWAGRRVDCAIAVAETREYTDPVYA